MPHSQAHGSKPAPGIDVSRCIKQTAASVRRLEAGLVMDGSSDVFSRLAGRSVVAVSQDGQVPVRGEVSNSGLESLVS